MKPFKLKKHKIKGLCAALYCTNKATGHLCGSHRSAKSRLADPVRYSYNSKKSRAKQRGIEFTITLEDFREFCHSVKYIGFTSRTATGYDLDRIREDEGYVKGNLQVLPKVENIKKYFMYDWRTKSAKIIK